MSAISTTADIECRWVSLPVAQSELGITERTVYRRVERGQLLSRRNASDRVEIGLPVADSSVTDTAEKSAVGATAAMQTPTDSATVSVTDMTDSQSFEEWRADLMSQLESSHARADRLEDDKAHLREQLANCEQELRNTAVVHGEDLASAREDCAGQVEASRAIIESKEMDIASRDSRISDLIGQVSALEAKVREVLEEGKSDSHQLANRIADLVQQHADIQTRVLELEPVAAEVPMLQAAVEDTKAELTQREQILFDRERQLADISDDIETIASRPVAGPVFRLLTKGKLRV